jgi:hypothetical protein
MKSKAVTTTPLFPNLYDDGNLHGGDERFVDSTEQLISELKFSKLT